MRCERCEGSGFIPAGWAEVPTVKGAKPLIRFAEPCPDCGGCGIIHCCEGERPDNPPASDTHL